MPPDQPLTLIEMDKRLKALEDSKITVKELPMNALRKSLAREPQSPTDILLPHSVTAGLLAADAVPRSVVELPLSGSISGISFTPIAVTGLTYTVPTTGRYKTTVYATCEGGAAGILIAVWITPLGAITNSAENIGASSNVRETISMAWSGEIKAGETVQTWVQTSSGASGILWGGGHTKMFVERIG